MELKSWHAFRWVLIAIGIVMVAYAYVKHDAAFGIFGFLFAYQGLMNVGCMECVRYFSRKRSRNDDNSDDITFEEII